MFTLKRKVDVTDHITKTEKAKMYESLDTTSKTSVECVLSSWMGETGFCLFSKNLSGHKRDYGFC